jgi:hypothetical protein
MTWLAVAGGVAILLAAGVWKLRSKFSDWETEQDDWDTSIDLGSADDLAFDEAEHVKALSPKLVFVPDGFTCLGCRENPALPFEVWCGVCRPSAWSATAEPIERGQR